MTAGHMILHIQSQANSMTSRRRSKAAIGITAVYVLLSLAAAALPLLAKKGESLAGVYLALFALPWTIVLGSLTERFGIDSLVFNYAFLLFGIFVNAVLLYWIVAALAQWRTAKASSE